MGTRSKVFIPSRMGKKRDVPSRVLKHRTNDTGGREACRFGRSAGQSFVRM